MLAQSRQQSQLLQEQIASDANAASRYDGSAGIDAERNEQLRGRTTAMAAGLQIRNQAEIRANNTLAAKHDDHQHAGHQCPAGRRRHPHRVAE